MSNRLMLRRIKKNNVVQNGLIFFVDAKNNASYNGTGTTWFDLQNNYDGTLINNPTFDSTVGFFDFSVTNSISNHGLLDMADLNTNGFTVNIWWNGAFNNLGYLFGNGGAFSVRGFGLFFLSSRVRFELQGQNNREFIDLFTSDGIVFNQWMNTTFSFNISTQNLKSYINGVLVETKNTSITTLQNGATTEDVYIGNEDNSTMNLNSSEAKISVAQIYDRPLDDTEVLQNYDFFKNRY